ncbi:MAG: hypothetical protein JRC92_10680, partial [Deltaproteobacteria bacterium]|nr:hypothetical protein [Deltaproteobacteria bacterium]
MPKSASQLTIMDQLIRDVASNPDPASVFGQVLAGILDLVGPQAAASI